jgi:LETM1 and EF-hand domain-containing protein 1
VLARREISVGSITRGRRTTDQVLRVLAVNYVNGVNQWKSSSSRGQYRTVSTETRTPDTKPFPLPTTIQPQQQPNARTPPPPMPPTPPPTTSHSQKSDSSVSADTAQQPTTTSTTVTQEATIPSESEASTAVEKKDKPEKKLTLWQKVKKEAVHYWDGTKLLGKEIRISFRLALKMAAGYELSRRESRQLKRTTQDLVRLVPFSVFVIVPFAELLLPVALKLFPNMLPSTYEGEKVKEAKRMALSKTRKDVSQFLRTTIQESGLYISKATRQSEEFSDFFKKV